MTLGNQPIGSRQPAKPLAELIAANSDIFTPKLGQEFAGLKQRGGSYWSMPPERETLSHKWWVVSVLWQCAQAYVAGREYLSVAAYTDCAALTARARILTQNAVQAQSAYDSTQRLDEKIKREQFPPFSTDASVQPAVWSALETLIFEVTSRMIRTEEMGVPQHLRGLFKLIQRKVNERIPLLQHEHTEWERITDAQTRTRIVAGVLPAMSELFELGQVMVAPSLADAAFKQKYGWGAHAEDLELAFDIWALTSPWDRVRLGKNAAASQQLTKFWASVSNLGEASAIVEFFNAGVRTRRLRRRSVRYNEAPWVSQFLVRAPMQYGGRSFTVGDLIVPYLLPEGSGAVRLEVRKTGRVLSIREMLGQ